jgi:hypothetical protein
VPEILIEEEDDEIAAVECVDVYEHSIDYIFTPADFGVLVDYSSVELAWLNYAAIADSENVIVGDGNWKKFVVSGFMLVRSQDREIWCADNGVLYDGVFDCDSINIMYRDYMQTYHDRGVLSPRQRMMSSGLFLLHWWESYLKTNVDLLCSIAYGICRAWWLGGVPLNIKPVVVVGLSTTEWMMPSCDIMELFFKRFGRRLNDMQFKSPQGDYTPYVTIETKDVLRWSREPGGCLPPAYRGLLQQVNRRGFILNVVGPPDEVAEIAAHYPHPIATGSRRGMVWKPPYLPQNSNRPHDMRSAVSLLNLLTRLDKVIYRQDRRVPP